MLYFDHNATHPISERARTAWLDAVARFPGNPSSPHRLGARAETALGEAREKIAALLGCDSHDIVWTSGATESNNMAVQHFSVNAEGEALVSAIEHPCVLAAARRYFGKRCRPIPVRSDGLIDVTWLRDALLQGKAAVVAVMAANNETGVLQPWNEIAAVCREHQVPYHCDAAQWIGKLTARGLGECDFVSGCAHKFGGPQGVGFLKCPSRTRALIVGGPQEEGRRAGTENVAGVLAMVAALEEREGTAIDSKFAMRSEFEAALVREVPGIRVVAANADRLWNTVSIIMPELPDCRQRWVVKLDKLGFAVSTGSACASGKEQPSHVLAAMGLSPAEAGRALRFSSGWDTRADDWLALLDGIKRAAEAAT